MVWKGTGICRLLSRYGWNIILKTSLPRLEDAHGSRLNHDLRTKKNIVQRCLHI